jgi:tetratricopeptide (TPR) repeat protein
LKALEVYPESPGVNLWSAVLWGSWAEVYGKTKAAKKGVAGKIRKLCEKVIELDSTFNDAGGYRVLGRLHFKSPRIPLILGWPSKKKAVEYLQKADRIAPGNLFTKLYLAEALYKRKEKDRAVELIEEILDAEEASVGVVETAYIKEEAEEDLRKWTQKGQSP